MYIPHYFNDSTPEEVKEFIDKHSFGTLFNQTKGKYWASHIPMELETNEDGKDILVGHISKGNRQWKGFKERDDVLAVFLGQHTYVSSTWYNHENVPTWNYIAVHVYGKIKIIEEERLRDSLKNLMNKYEAMTQTHLKLEDLSEKMVDREIKGIVGFEILIDEVQAAFKLSQNRDEESYDNVVEELSKSDEENEKEVGRIMAKRRE